MRFRMDTNENYGKMFKEIFGQSDKDLIDIKMENSKLPITHSTSLSLKNLMDFIASDKVEPVLLTLQYSEDQYKKLISEAVKLDGKIMLARIIKDTAPYNALGEMYSSLLKHEIASIWAKKSDELHTLMVDKIQADRFLGLHTLPPSPKIKPEDRNKILQEKAIEVKRKNPTWDKTSIAQEVLEILKRENSRIVKKPNGSFHSVGTIERAINTTKTRRK